MLTITVVVIVIIVIVVVVVVFVFIIIIIIITTTTTTTTIIIIIIIIATTFTASSPLHPPFHLLSPVIVVVVVERERRPDHAEPLPWLHQLHAGHGVRRRQQDGLHLTVCRSEKLTMLYNYVDFLYFLISSIPKQPLHKKSLAENESS
jgi:hypothetical protein